MSTNAVTPSYYADFSGLDGLKKSAQANDPGALREAARQFESLFTNMLLKTMRETKFGDALGDSQETEFYQGMYDQQLAVQLSKGKGLGLADMLVQQLSRAGTAAATPPAPTKGATPGATPGATAMPGTHADGAVSHAQRLGFIRQLEPLVTRAASQLGVSVDAIIAQAALETGWGSHSPATASGAPSFNLFGVKQGSAWAGPTAPARTSEVLGGKASELTQNFRSYASPQASVTDYVAVLQGSPRYRQALGTGDNIHAFATALARGGYATDPDYVNKLAATAGTIRELRTSTAALPLNIVAGQPTTSGGELV